jgi:hypothetical protein
VSTLAQLRDLVELDLDDAGNAVWTTDEIDRGIGRALSEYSHVNPAQAVGTIALTEDGREVSLTSLTGLISVVRVWWPYTAGDPEYPPEWVRWQTWAGTLYIVSGSEPQSGDVVRVYYHKEQTVDGLAGEDATSVPSPDEEVILLGAGGYCALAKGRGAVGEVGVSEDTPEHWLRWSTGRLDAFNEALWRVRAREVRRLDKRAPLWREGWEA